VLLCVLTIVALPGLIMTVPIAVGANRVAKGKAREAVKGSFSPLMYGMILMGTK